MTTRRLLLLGLFAASLYTVFLVLRPLIPGIAWAIVLVTTFYPLYTRLVGLMRGREWAAALTLSFVVAAAIVLPLSLAAVRISEAITRVYDFLARRASDPNATDPIHELFRFLAGIRTFLGQYIDVSDVDLQKSFLDGAQQMTATLSARSATFLGNALEAFLTVLVMLVTMAFLFKESRRIVDEVGRSLPLTIEDRTRVFREFRSVVHAVFYGVMMTALIQAFLGGIGLAIVGLPAVTLGGLMFFCALLPFGGTMLVWLPAGIYLIMKGQPVAGGFLLAWGGLVVSMIDNVLRPIFVKGRTHMHLLLVSFGIFGGIAAFGFIGLFVGPLAIALFLFLLDVVRREGAQTA